MIMREQWREHVTHENNHHFENIEDKNLTKCETKCEKCVENVNFLSRNITLDEKKCCPPLPHKMFKVNESGIRWNRHFTLRDIAILQNVINREVIFPRKKT